MALGLTLGNPDPTKGVGWSTLGHTPTDPNEKLWQKRCEVEDYSIGAGALACLNSKCLNPKTLRHASTQTMPQSNTQRRPTHLAYRHPVCEYSTKIIYAGDDLCTFLSITLRPGIPEPTSAHLGPPRPTLAYRGIPCAHLGPTKQFLSLACPELPLAYLGLPGPSDLGLPLAYLGLHRPSLGTHRLT